MAPDDRSEREFSAEGLPRSEIPGPEDAALQRLLRDADLRPPAFRDEREAPRVDRELLRSLVRHRLARESERVVFWLICSYESWNYAHAEVLLEEYHGGSGGKC
jgi:hypothetical protein